MGYGGLTTGLLFCRHTKYFFYRRDALRRLEDPVLRHREHTLLFCLSLYFVRGAVFHDQAHDRRRDGKHFVNTDAACVACGRVDAAFWDKERHGFPCSIFGYYFLFLQCLQDRGRVDSFRKLGFLIASERALLLISTEAPDKPLTDNDTEGRNEKKRLDSHVEKACGGGGSRIGVECGEHEVTGKGRIDRKRGRFFVTDFAD